MKRVLQEIDESGMISFRPHGSKKPEIDMYLEGEIFVKKKT